MVYVLYQVYRPRKLNKFRMIYIMEFCTNPVPKIPKIPSLKVPSNHIKSTKTSSLHQASLPCWYMFFHPTCCRFVMIKQFLVASWPRTKGAWMMEIICFAGMGFYPHLLTLTGTMRRLSYLSRSYIHINLYLPQKEGRAHGKHVMICW